MRWTNFILALTFLVGLIFELTKRGLPEMEGLFPFVNDTQFLRSHIYFICEHIKVIMLSVVICLSPKLTIVTKTYMYICLFELVDYLLTNNNVYFKAFNYVPISYNTISIVIFTVVCIFDKWEPRWKK